MYKAVLFDLDNTLLNYSASELESMKRTCKDHDLFEDDPAGWSSFWQAYTEHNARHWFDFVGGGSVKSMPDVLKFSFRDALAGTEEHLHERLAATYWQYFCGSSIFEDGAEHLLSKLAGDYALGIVSNGIGEAQRGRLQAGRIADRFHSVIVSDEIGIRKPDARIFQQALRELGASREETLFIGDSLQDDYRGAVQAGIDFCYYNRSGSVLPAGVKPTYAVTHLSQVAELIM
ncbi:HAD-IA family hydrolase [Cohnella lubricantis]|uniref:HAD-IA family hydrolase n=1 Tax=Cohnella lubricantis TaxID=2163172 RepID=A0A841T9G8_9BACL|nr:HAD-IA family hydrolase [Cohnella lubricantis]